MGYDFKSKKKEKSSQSGDCDVFHLYVVQSRNLTFMVRAERRHSWSADGAASLSLPLSRAAQTTPWPLRTEDYQQNGYENHPTSAYSRWKRAVFL
jgi:hypothetical protein